MVYPADDARARLSLLRRDIEAALALVASMVPAPPPPAAPVASPCADERAPRVLATRVPARGVGDASTVRRNSSRWLRSCNSLLRAHSKDVRGRANHVLDRARNLRDKSTDLLRCSHALRDARPR